MYSCCVFCLLGDIFSCFMLKKCHYKTKDIPKGISCV